MDRVEREGARKKLEKLSRGGGGGDEGKVTRTVAEGEEVRDEYSHGVKADVVAAKKHPYQCHVCESSYVMAPQLSDHLKQKHDIYRHPSQIVPKGKLFEESED